MKEFAFLGAVILVIFAVTNNVFLTSSEANQLELEVKPQKETYQLGEPIQFEFGIKNASNKNIVILNGLGHLDGYLSVWISKDGKPFEKYDHTKWGITHSSKITALRPNESVINKALVFWNSKPKFSNSVASDIAERASAGRIKTDYAFPEAGTYYVKAAYSIFAADQAEATRIESQPVKIDIAEPTGDDLKVWNIIKDRGDFAYFLHEGEFLISSYKTQERAKFEQEIEVIINQYPDSMIATRMQHRLENYRSNENKIKKLTQKFKTKAQQKPE